MAKALVTGAAGSIGRALISELRRVAYEVVGVEELKQDILDGKYDERLGTDTAKLIFDALKDKAG